MTDQLLNIQGKFEGILGLGLPSSKAQKGLFQDASANSAESEAASAMADPMKAITDAAKEVMKKLQKKGSAEDGTSRDTPAANDAVEAGPEIKMPQTQADEEEVLDEDIAEELE